MFHYYRQVDVINEAIRIILLYNKSMETVCALLLHHSSNVYVRLLATFEKKFE